MNIVVRATCETCGKTFVLVDGKIPDHPSAHVANYRCIGSGQPPATPK